MSSKPLYFDLAFYHYHCHLDAAEFALFTQGERKRPMQALEFCFNLQYLSILEVS